MAESQPICDNKGNILQLEKNQKADVEIESDSLIEIILYSASVTFFNFSFDYSNSTPTAWKIAHVTQVMTSIVLIVLSLASYLSFKDVMDEDEVKEFLLIKYWEKRSKGEYKEFLERVESRSVDEIPEK
ncbi:hypothetical protein [Metabacillus endolithicus]|nr:hypothetical protein [Metabacillus endolithicus]UPG65535.1 hypothetical protein MVE64_11500 [Metabacillus endolithicus]